uniref:Disintegrin and metalloproteinase domain-containing protein 8 (Trinotate prediction) n=1 Tax=Myxobolus squamalis TaxID=59785 RepID=A0A6B2G4N0_MYXSQ
MAYISDPLMMSYTVAHEIGHNMGFQHTDHMSNCRCAAKDVQYCLMNSYNSYWYKISPKSIENCLMTTLLNELDKYQCLLKKTKIDRLFYTCGDGVADRGEDCDCGFEDLCVLTTKQSRCCNRETCRFLTETVQCSIGQCCDNCQFVHQQLCRESVGECDYTEYCNGSHNECPVNVFRTDYEMCGHTDGFCYDGLCSNMDLQCKKAYNDPEAYYSQECVSAVKEIMTRCDNPYNELEQLLCYNPNICHHFICGRPEYLLYETTGFLVGNTVCFIPLPQIRIGLLQFGSNYMKCSDSGRGV